MAKWGEINCSRCAELEAKLRKSALQEISALGQASEAYQAQLAAEAKLAQVTAAYRIEVMQRGPWVSHEDFDRHIREITGDYDE